MRNSSAPGATAALIFGLLHGFAFAGALAETGLPEGDIPVALLLFNLGVEAGQLLFVGVLLVVMLVWRQLRSSPSSSRGGGSSAGTGGGASWAAAAAWPHSLPPPAALAAPLPETSSWRIKHRLAPYAMGCYAGFLFVECTAAAFA